MFSFWVWNMIARNLLTLDEACAELRLELLYRRVGIPGRMDEYGFARPL